MPGFADSKLTVWVASAPLSAGRAQESPKVPHPGAHCPIFGSVTDNTHGDIVSPGSEDHDPPTSGEPAPTPPPDATYRWDPAMLRWTRFAGGTYWPAVYSGAEDWLRSEHAFHPANVMDDAKRERIFEKAMTEELLQGSNVLQRDSFSAVVGRTKRVSHGLHAFLTVITLGMWSVVWIVMSVARKEIRTRLSIDRWGHVWRVEGTGSS